MGTLFFLGLIFVTGALAEWLSPRLHLSKVVSYLFMGILIAPSTTGIIPEAFLDHSAVVIDLSLALIALLIGATLKISELKGMARQIIVITVFQSFAAFVIVTTGFFLLSSWVFEDLKEPLAVAMLLGGIATATAPAATLAIIKEVRVSNAFSRILLAVVALDDAVALLLFALGVTVSISIMASHATEWAILTHSLYVLVGSIILGSAGGFLATGFEKLFHRYKGVETIATMGTLFMVYGASEFFVLEPILVALVMGAVLTNLSKDFYLVEEEIDKHIVEIVFMLFFMLSAMHLNLESLRSLPLAIMLYIILRFVAKIAGTYLGSRLTQASVDVRRYLGLGLLPQAGVALGLALSLQDYVLFEPFAPMILNLVIATTLIHEFTAPFFTRYALLRTKRRTKK